jgi:hypothetical protein
MTKLNAFERFFDRTIGVYFVGLGLVLTGAMAFLGG